MRKIIQTLAENQTVKEYFLLTSIQSKLGKNGTYLEMMLADASGEIKARKWDLTEHDLQFFELVQHELPQIVLVKGMTRKFQESIDLKVFYVVLPYEDAGVSMNDFICAAPINIEEALKEIEETVHHLKNYQIKSIVREIFDVYRPFLSQFPASTYHHRVYGGLIWHTINTIKLAKLVLTLYPTHLNGDLLIAGAILHDFAKIKDYKVKKGVISEVTDKVKMKGHIVYMAQEIRDTARRLDIDINCSEVEYLEHIILSHHGRKEYGSPVEPALAEAVALHLIDVLDSKVGASYQLLENVSCGAWSDFSIMLDGKLKKIDI